MGIVPGPPFHDTTVTTVPRRSRHSSHRSCIATSATFRQPTPAHCASLSTQHVRTSGFFRSLVRRSGTHCQMNSEIRRVMSTASNSSSKQSCSALTSVTRALEVIFNVMRSINPRFTYFTYYCDPSVETLTLRRSTSF